ncbi:MAG: tryptophan--tRNA ligase [Betaproteobacteria bacterium]|nr:tryptophan--tRNA ligase [Betaproteobacteria bacterium]
MTQPQPIHTTHIPGRVRVLTGAKPTADLHVGNYFGAIRPAIEASHDPAKEVILMCVDWHGLTDRAKILEPGKFSASLLATYLTMGFSLENNMVILQSEIPEIPEMAWYLSCVSAVGLLERAHAYKDALGSGKEPTVGLFNYPILMASDIVTFDAQVVPVGKDQSQHLEYASDMVKLFNNAVGRPVLFEPKAEIQPTPLLIGIDGERKMSKSYGNHVPLFAPKKEIEKKIKEIKTDSKGLDDPKDPESCAVFQIMKSFGSKEAIAYMEERLRQGTGYGYGHAKKDLIDEHERVFGSKRELYEHYLNSPRELAQVLAPSHQRARTIAATVRQRVRDALSLGIL